MRQINIPNDYPLEIATPDIAPYAKSNTGVPFVWRFDSGQPGPNVMVSAIVHGNEPCGVVALDWLLQQDIRPVAGSLTLAFMNIEAYRAFDPEDPNRSRWIDEDMKRETLEAMRQGRTFPEVEGLWEHYRSAAAKGGSE